MIDTCGTYLDVHVERERVETLKMNESGIDRRRVTLHSPLEMFRRRFARWCLFTNVIVQMPLMVEDIGARVEQQDLVDVLVDNVMTQTKPVQVSFVQYRLHRQREGELQTAQASEATGNTISECSKCGSICRRKRKRSRRNVDHTSPYLRHCS